MSLYLFLMALALVPLAQDEPAGDEMPLGGPITDLVEKRISALGERLQKRFDDDYGSRFGGLLSEIREARRELAEIRNDRTGIVKELAEFRREKTGLIESIRELRSDREGLLSRIANMRSEIAANRAENEKRWTPLQNLLDRLTGFVWKLFFLLLSVVVVFGLFAAALFIGYAKLKAQIIGV